MTHAHIVWLVVAAGLLAGCSEDPSSPPSEQHQAAQEKQAKPSAGKAEAPEPPTADQGAADKAVKNAKAGRTAPIGNLDSLPPDLRPLVQEMRQGQGEVRRAAIEALGELKATAQPALPHLREMMSDSDARVRIAAAKAIAAIQADCDKQPVDPAQVAGYYLASLPPEGAFSEVTWKVVKLPANEVKSDLPSHIYSPLRDKSLARAFAKREEQSAEAARELVASMLRRSFWVIDKRGALSLALRPPRSPAGAPPPPTLGKDDLVIGAACQVKDGKTAFEPLKSGQVSVIGRLARRDGTLQADLRLTVTTADHSIAAAATVNLDPKTKEEVEKMMGADK